MNIPQGRRSNLDRTYVNSGSTSSSSSALAVSSGSTSGSRSTTNRTYIQPEPTSVASYVAPSNTRPVQRTYVNPTPTVLGSTSPTRNSPIRSSATRNSPTISSANANYSRQQNPVFRTVNINYSKPKRMNYSIDTQPVRREPSPLRVNYVTTRRSESTKHISRSPSPYFYGSNASPVAEENESYCLTLFLTIVIIGGFILLICFFIL